MRFATYFSLTGRRSYIHYAFLKHLIKKSGTDELKKEMAHYIAELEEFEKKTSVQDLNSAMQEKRVLIT